MSNTRWRNKRLLGVAAGLAALTFGAFAACGDDGDDGDSTPVPTPIVGDFDYESLDGSLSSDGSSTVFPISEAVAEEFASVANDVRVNVGQSGTGGGFERLCRGEVEVSAASRPIREDETQACIDEGITDLVELRVATDALTVVVNGSNDFVTCLTVQQLHDVFTGQANNWNEVDPSFPDAEIVRFFPGTDSGTFDYFVEQVIEGVDEGASHTGDGTASEDDNVLAQGVEGEENAIGYFGFAYYQEAGSQLKAVEIDGGSGCVAPSVETAVDGTYAPLSRPLFIYTSGALLAEGTEVLGFVNFYLENSQVLAEEVGYIPLADDDLEDQLAKLDQYMP